MGHTNVQKQKMTNNFRSTKGASKQRRDQINNEITRLRDILPLPESARQRLSQLQVMSLTCCFIRKCNYFSRLFGNSATLGDPEASYEFSQAMTGFLLITTREGKLLYISENVTEYLGHSMVDMMTQGDSLYDIIDKRDHQNVQNQLLQTNYTPPAGEERTFFCRMNVSRSFRRHAGFGDHKVMHIRGHFISPMLGGDHYGNQPVFMAMCAPLVTPDVKETAMTHNTLMFQSVHSLDMNYIEIAPNAEYHLGYTNGEIKGRSWYSMLHPEDIHEAKEKHVQLVKSSHEAGCMLTVRLQTSTMDWIWVNMVMAIRQPFVCDNGDPAIVCSNYIIKENEAPLFKLQSQYHSSHIVRSPECLGSSQGASPSHTISHVSADEGSMYGSASNSQDGTNVTFRADFGILPANPGGYGGHNLSADAAILSDSSSEPSPQNVDVKPTREAILNRLKRKVKGEDQCKPQKLPRMSTPDYHDNGGGLSTIQASAFITASPLVYNADMGGDSGLFVMTNVGMHSEPVYANLKKGIEPMVVPEPPKMNPTISATTLDLTQPMSQPLTPESIASDISDMGQSSPAHIYMDITDSAIVPSSVLTPESSPSSSPVYHNSEIDLTLSEYNDDLSIFENPLKLQIKTEQETSIGVDDQSMLEYIKDLDLAVKTSQALIRSAKPHQNPQTRIAEIEAALKLGVFAHQQKQQQFQAMSPDYNTPSPSTLTIPTHSQENTMTTSQSLQQPPSPIPLSVSAMNQPPLSTTTSSTTTQMSLPDPQLTLATTLTDALLRMAQTKGAENLSMADIDFMLVPELAPQSDPVIQDATLMACLGALNSDEQNYSGDLLDKVIEELATNAPSNGDVEQLTRAASRPAL